MTASSYPKIKVGVLGATGEDILTPISTANVQVGTVGQRFIQQLAIHPYFVLHTLGASSRSAGQPYSKAVRWKLGTPIPEAVRGMVVQECKPGAQGFSECGVVFSGLDSDVAGEIGK